ncbi:hypothetical protein Scep_023940 [Stephania cephalantha]|uniref:Uncharacterized protein n=1 Tax=Stephania cephalantha TaxID=152367 RepID=A0AAP0EVL2_9MAGN
MTRHRINHLANLFANPNCFKEHSTTIRLIFKPQPQWDLALHKNVTRHIS